MNSKLLIFVLLYGSSLSFADILVDLPNGKVRGEVLQTPNKMDFYSFQGIPYAKPPLGDLRFQAPQPVENWNGTLNATKTSNRCYSVAKDTDDESEDCLYLNVYTPILESENKTKLPVMVFIYGGGFRDGASAYNVYGPDYMLEQGVVVVSFNYRVGPFGFLSTGDDVIPGNAGLKDQLLAIKWTNKNIGLFGGDPSKITLFGQSAGAASVCFHILSKQSAGLFRAGIAESGSALNIWGYSPDPRPIGFELASLIGGKDLADNSTKLLQFLVKAKAKDIDVASTKTSKLALPVIEKGGDGAFLETEMFEQLYSGDINKVPLLIGINSEESLSKASNVTSLHDELVKYDNDLTLLIPDNLNLTDGADRTQIAKYIRYVYLFKTADLKWQNNLGRSIAYFSDNSYTRPIIKHAELQSNYTDVYFYQFSHKGPMGNTNIPILPRSEKVGHGEERYYYFRTQTDTYDNSDLSKFPVSDIQTHHRIVRIWTNFAKTMNPTPEQSDLLQDIIWPKVTPNNFQYVDIGDNLEIKTNPVEARYTGWNTVYGTYATRPLTTY